MSVSLDGLFAAPAVPLFADDANARRLDEMLGTVRARYGVKAMLFGHCVDRSSRYTGAKIAYQSFPDAVRLRWLGIVGVDWGQQRDCVDVASASV